MCFNQTERDMIAKDRQLASVRFQQQWSAYQEMGVAPSVAQGVERGSHVGADFRKPRYKYS